MLQNGYANSYLLKMPAKPVQSRRAKNQPKFTADGRPGKRTPQLEKDLLAAIATGAPYRVACMAVGISDDAFTEWRRRDPEFRQKVEQAAGQTALSIMKRIREHGEENFSALAWILERRFPGDFGRPEAQFQISMMSNSVTNNTLVITAEVADSVVKRQKEVHSKIEKLFESRRLKNAAGNGASKKEPEPAVEMEVEAEVVLPAITLPAGEPSPAWWTSLSQGGNERLVAQEAAIYVCRTLLREVRGPVHTRNTAVVFSEPVTLRDLHEKIQRLVGPAGWQLMVKKGETV